MSEQYLRGVLGFKGERGYSAYEIALQNGFIGTEKEWLSQLGVSKTFEQKKEIYTSTAGQTAFDISNIYISGDFIDVYVNGFKLNANEYEVNVETRQVVLVGLVLEEGQTVEIVATTTSSSELPIVTNINQSSTDETVPSTKAVYDHFEQFINTIYPVGSIYMSANETSPETLFGGTWEQIKDTFLLAAGDTYAAGSTGGEATHKLTLDEMPNHRHGIANANENGADFAFTPVLLGDMNKGWEGSSFTAYEGGGQAHNNMPPYLTVYMWKRIS